MSGTIPVVGTDGHVPIYDPEARWTIWSIYQIWLGGAGLGKFVPKVNDYVIDPATYTMQIVLSLDPITLVPNMRPIRPGNLSYIVNELDILVGVGPGTMADVYRVYLDTTSIPHTLAVDTQLKVYGSLTKYCRLFRGSDLSPTGTVVSQVYDAGNNLLGDLINLELVGYNSHDNYAIKAVPPCKTMAQMPDGEIVTAVFYDDDGHVVSRRQLIVNNTSFIRQAFDEQKYITNISLECPFMSETIDHEIEFPLNVPLNALNLIGVVHYNDGSTLRLPVDGSKFRVIGLDHYVSTIVGQKIQLVLSYTLADNEATYGAVTSDGKYITRPFSLITVEPNNAYTVKVFGYPEWLNIHEGYRMRWFLLNLDRNLFADVTPHVNFTENTGVFNPTGYGYIQRKAITLALNEVSGAYRHFIHTQLLDIILRGIPDTYDTAWEVTNEAVETHSVYGHQLKAQKVPLLPNRFTIHSGINSLDEWLTRVYRHTYPLMNSQIETSIPTPTHFEVFYNTHIQRYPISDWNKQLSLPIEIPLLKTIYIKFLKQTGSGDLILSVAGMVMKT